MAPAFTTTSCFESIQAKKGEWHSLNSITHYLHSVCSIPLAPSPFRSLYEVIFCQAPCFPRSLTKWDHSESEPGAQDKYSKCIFAQSQCLVKSSTCLSPTNPQFQARWHNCGLAPPEIDTATCAPVLFIHSMCEIFRKAYFRPCQD